VILPDVNVLVYAFRDAAPDHARYRAWLSATLRADEPVGLADAVLAGLIRVLTHPRVFSPPATLAAALACADSLRAHPLCAVVHPGPRHWDIFSRLCTTAGARGNLVPDAYLAALAIEHGCEFVTADRDFARFAGLRRRHPLD